MNLEQNIFSNKIKEIDFLNGYRKDGQDHYYYETFLKKKSNNDLIFVVHHHGYCDNASMNSSIFNYLIKSFENNDSSIVLASFDNYGHGNSSGDRLSIDNFDKYISRAEMFLKDMLETYSSYKNIKIIMSGHSMGGFIMANLAKKIQNDPLFADKIKGLFLLSPYFFLNEDKPFTALVLNNLVKIPLIGKMIGNIIIPTGGKTLDICNDVEYSKILDNLYSYGKNYFTLNWITIMRNSQIEFKNMSKSDWRIKTYVLMASDDRLVSNEMTQSFYDSLPADSKIACETSTNTMHKIFFSSDRSKAAEKYFNAMATLLV